MEDEEMGPGGEESETMIRQKSKALASALNALASAASKLSSRSRGIPSNTDFHFYNNFPDFKSPVRDITAVAPSTISTIADSPVLRLGNAPFPRNDLDDAFDWVVNLNDELLERFGASMDEFKQERAKEEENGKKNGGDENGFQLVQGKNKKKNTNEESTSTAGYSSTGVSVATKDKWTSGATKSKVPFHIPSIPRPQDEYRILVNNANLPFQHVWLEKSSDGSCFIHPLEKSSVMDFVDKTIGENEPEKPAQIESTSFKLVEELKDLKEMVAKLKEVNEFAVDLEHNQYRSFQGLTCLMQISTRTEDFVVDTLKLRIYIGSYLRDLFKDPSKRKVMHGADHDILWLQRDFGIYVCNLFDTGQASRVLQLERNSLEFLLHYFCDVTANKEYQNADWRLRPLPTEMVKYAREDTHYLLYIYDLMRLRLISESTIENDLLLEVHRRSDEICLKMYEKELFTDTSFLNLYGVQQTELNARQLAIVAGLYQWRDFIARSDDESTGYVLPNKSLIEIAKEMPATSDKLLRLVKSRHSYVERYLPSIIEIIRNSFSQSHAFESIASQLKQSQLDKAKAREGESGEQDRPVTVQMAPPRTPSVVSQIVTPVNNGKITASVPLFVPSQINNVTAPPKMASVQILKKPGSFGALFARPVKKPSFIFGSSVIQREESKSKLEKIKQSVTLPFNFGAGEKSSLTNSTSNDTVMMQAPPPPPPSLGTENTQVQVPANPTITEDIIPLEVEKETKEDEEQDNDNSSDDDIQGVKHREWFPRQNEDEQTIEDSDDSDDSDVPTELSSSFEKCFKSISEMRNPQQTQHKPVVQNNNNMVSIQLEPFDYDAARKINKNKNDDDDEDVDIKNKNKERNRNSKIKRAASRKEKGERGGGGGGEKESGFQQPRRSQAFPMSGNRSTTYI